MNPIQDTDINVHIWKWIQRISIYWFLLCAWMLLYMKYCPIVQQPLKTYHSGNIRTQLTVTNHGSDPENRRQLTRSNMLAPVVINPCVSFFFLPPTKPHPQLSPNKYRKNPRQNGERKYGSDPLEPPSVTFRATTSFLLQVTMIVMGFGYWNGKWTRCHRLCPFGGQFLPWLRADDETDGDVTVDPWSGSSMMHSKKCLRFTEHLRQISTI